jgi:integrase
MSINRREGSRFWSYDFTVRGRRFRGSTEVEDKAAAQVIADDLRKEVVLGNRFGAKRKPITIAEAFGRYFDEKAKGRPSEADVDRMLDRMGDELGNDQFLHSDDMLDRIAKMIARRRGDMVQVGSVIVGTKVIGYTKRGKPKVRPIRKPILEPIANATVNRDIELLRRVWRRADKAWKKDVGEEIAWGELLLEEPDERERSLSRDELDRLLEAATVIFPELIPAIMFALMIGARLGNVIGLKWEQVHLTGAEPDVKFRVKSKKPGGEIRRLPLPRDAVLLLANLSGQHETNVFSYTVRKKRGARLVGQRLPFTKTGTHKRWKKILAAAKVEDFRWHDLRHTAGTWTLRRTRNLALVKKMLGHKRIESTMRYAHVLDEDLRQGMEATAADFRADSVAEKEADSPKLLEDQSKKAAG